MRFCLRALTALHLLLADDPVPRIDAIMRRAFTEEASTLDYASAVLHLGDFERALKRKPHKHVLEWVNLELADQSGLYGQLQELKRTYGRVE